MPSALLSPVSKIFAWAGAAIILFFYHVTRPGALFYLFSAVLLQISTARAM